MERMPIYALNDCNSTGVDKVPVKKLMLNKQTGGLFNLADRTGLTNTLKFKDFAGKFFSMEPADFDDVCPATPPMIVTVNTWILILYAFPHDVPGYTNHTLITRNNVSGYLIDGTILMVNPLDKRQALKEDGQVFYTYPTEIISGVLAQLRPDGTWVETDLRDSYRQYILDDWDFNSSPGLIWDRTGE